MLVLSTLIGVYFGYWGKKEDSPHEYLLAGKTMSTLPVAVSLVAR
jgi:Na+/proline symporter